MHIAKIPIKVRETVSNILVQHNKNKKQYQKAPVV